MTPPSPTKGERRAQILEAALACFARRGYHLTTMDDIVAESGLSKGSLYWHYNSKKEILLATMDWYFERLAVDFEAVLQESPTPLGMLQVVGDRFAEILAAMDPVLQVMLDFYAETRHDEAVNAALNNILVPYIDMVEGVIQAGIEAGEIRPVHARQMAIAIMAALDGVGVYQMMLDAPVDWGATGRQLVDVLLAGLRAQSPTGGDAP
ncbi:MAG: TetR/AcrR family transcriptional regulator [Anaerolineae bacterium]